ncbi:MAG TPA: S-methyl-5-thioribose-1-phosphate isomerase [Phycisphaerae bacterium]|nr:S-methyl-5-thioribose-1-phosphate isomerase [Phycisphaerae bacterium]
MRSTGQRETLRPVWWDETVPPHGALKLIDQTRLPAELAYVTCTTLQSVWQAIKTLQVRGAPAIGVAAAYGVIVGLNEFSPGDRTWRETVNKICDHLATSRPTAANLFWALNRMRKRADQLGDCGWPEARRALLAEAGTIRDEDAAMCRAIGATGRNLIQEGAGVLTHCNAGALATSEYGTALAVMYAAHERGLRFTAYVDETRPLLQGARLTAWELTRAGIESVLICDNMAASLMLQRKISLVITGADRIARNGDAANKIGTYGIAVLAAAHGIPFYIAAPSSTFDLSLRDGSQIPIEFRDPEEVRSVMGQRIAPPEVACYCPAFDVTPARLITGIITEKGLICPVILDSIRALLTR